MTAVIKPCHEKMKEKENTKILQINSHRKIHIGLLGFLLVMLFVSPFSDKLNSTMSHTDVVVNQCRKVCYAYLEFSQPSTKNPT